MKTTVYSMPLLACIFLWVLASCSKVPLNEVDGSFFYRENTRVEFEDKGYMIKDSNGNLAIACYSGPALIGGERDCINIIVPSSCYSLSKNQL